MQHLHIVFVSIARRVTAPSEFAVAFYDVNWHIMFLHIARARCISEFVRRKLNRIACDNLFWSNFEKPQKYRSFGCHWHPFIRWFKHSFEWRWNEIIINFLRPRARLQNCSEHRSDWWYHQVHALYTEPNLEYTKMPQQQKSWIRVSTDTSNNGKKKKCLELESNSQSGGTGIIQCLPEYCRSICWCLV